jgi:hypothetical protein
MMHVTYWPKALALGAELRTQARVERITTDARGRADGAVYIDLHTGARHHQRATRVVLCANGLGTPRLLFLSADHAHPHGLANSPDWSAFDASRLVRHRTVFQQPSMCSPGPTARRSSPRSSTDRCRTGLRQLTFQVGRMTAARALGLPWGVRIAPPSPVRSTTSVDRHSDGRPPPTRTASLDRGASIPAACPA